jgi:hypothetical protein
VFAQDTIYVSDRAKSYLFFDAPVKLADVGNPALYQARIEGNSIMVVATQDSVAITPFYAEVDNEPFTALLAYRTHPKAFYDFRKRNHEDEQLSKERAITRLRSLSVHNDLNYVSARKDGIYFQLVGLLHDLTTTYLKFRVENNTSLPYKTDFIGFEQRKRYKKNFWAKTRQTRFPLAPEAQWRVNPVFPYSEGYLYYALPLYALEARETVIATLREKSGSRSISLTIPTRLWRKATLYDSP